MKRRWISSPRRSSSNCACRTAPCTASVISMNRTARWNATTGTSAAAHAATTGAGTSRQLVPSSTASAASPWSTSDVAQAVWCAASQPRAETRGEHELAALEQIVGVRHLDHVRPADVAARAPPSPVTTWGSARRTTGRSRTASRAQHDGSSTIIAQHPTDRPLRSALSRGRVPGVSEADIHLERVTKRFADTTAVDDLTMSIPRGASTPCSGPSGCGKTTTLRMIGGFEDPTEGQVFLGGNEVTHLPPYRRDVNTVFQSYALFPHLSVEKNVAFGLERKKVGQGRGPPPRRRVAGARAARPPGQAQAVAALRRPAAARRAGPRAGQPPARAAPGRAARRARPAPAQAAADRAQAHPARRRHHVRARHARPGGGHVHGRHHRGDERRPDRAGRRRGRPLRAPADRVRGQLPRRLQPRGREDQRPRQRADAARDPRRRHAARPVRALRPEHDRRRARRRAAGEDHAAARRRRRCPTAPTSCAARSSWPRSSASPSSTSSRRPAARSSTCSRRTPTARSRSRSARAAPSSSPGGPEHTFVVGRG